MKNYTLSVPCKTYVYKYFTRLHGAVIPLSHNTVFADNILTKLAHTPICQANKSLMENEQKRYTASLKFLIPFDFFYRIPIPLQLKNIYAVNRVLENELKEEIIKALGYSTVVKISHRQIIEKFALKYGIVLDEDITMAGIIKAWQRHRQTPVYSNKFSVIDVINN